MFKQSVNVTTLLYFGLVAFLLLGILGRILGYEIRKDEQLFVPPAAFLDDTRLYAEVFYNHVPVSAWYFFGLNTLFGGGSPLLAARFGVFLAWIILAFSMWYSLFKITHSRHLALFAVIALLTHSGFQDQSGMTATNNFLPMPLIFSGLALFCFGIMQPKNRFWILFFAGVCLPLAAATKASALFFIPVIALAAFFLPRELSFVDRLRKVVFPLVIGGLIGSMPVFIYLGKDHTNFLAHVVGFHTGPHIDYWEARLAADNAPPFHLRQKVLVAFSSWFASASFLLCLVTAYLTVMRWSHRKEAETVDGNNIGLILTMCGCLVASAWMSFVPTPSFPQYFMQSFLCLPLLIALLFARLSRDRKLQTYPVLVAAMVLLVIISLPRLLPSYGSFVWYEKTAVARAQSAGDSINEAMNERGLKGKVFTFFPIYPVEGDVPVYDEIATGEFAYRIWPYLTPKLEAEYVTTNRNDLLSLFAEDPPGALLLGFLEVLEEPLVQYAKENNYEVAPNFDLSNRYGKAVLYLSPRK
jgi:hypothetical protein